MTKDESLQQRLRILLVEDDTDIAQLVLLHLEDLDAQVKHTDRGDTALQLAQSESWDLIILDLRLPGRNGLDICRELREQGDYTPILMLTAKSSELDRVLGLELGADDYLTKPFSPLELVARVKAILRRVSRLQRLTLEAQETGNLRCGPLNISVKHHSVTLEDRELELTSKEFDLLLHFARHPGQVFRRSELLDQVWGYGHEGYEHTVNSHINRLRAKIEDDPSSPSLIITVWGVGYKFNETLTAVAP
ncbi:MAG: response regulator transcription factor [Gammaproteobacteria bacterium]|nr:response regulator transcription factor [Gammaproteobacteria bacterium]